MRNLIRETVLLRAFGLFKIPLIFFLRPTVVELTERRSVVKIPLSYRSKNHLNSMYFGVLCVGADLAGGLLAMKFIGKSDIALVFKDFKADFLKRPDGDVHFACEDGEQIGELVRRTLASGERENYTLSVTATVPKNGPEPVARFALTLSLKKKSRTRD